MRINDQLTARAVAHTADMPWVASPMPGVERRMLERQGVDGARRATSIVRYAPGSRFSPHDHPAGEEFLVLGGTFSDERGDYPAGSYVRNPPGSRHAPFSAGGTTIFVKLQQFAADDLARVVIDTRARAWLDGDEDSVARLPLHAHGAVRVALERWQAGARPERRVYPGGAEILVLDGGFADESGDYPIGTWLRLPPGSGLAASSKAGCTLYLKHGHFG